MPPFFDARKGMSGTEIGPISMCRTLLLPAAPASPVTLPGRSVGGSAPPSGYEVHLASKPRISGAIPAHGGGPEGSRR